MFGRDLFFSNRAQFIFLQIFSIIFAVVVVLDLKDRQHEKESKKSGTKKMDSQSTHAKHYH